MNDKEFYNKACDFAAERVREGQHYVCLLLCDAFDSDGEDGYGKAHSRMVGDGVRLFIQEYMREHDEQAEMHALDGDGDLTAEDCFEFAACSGLEEFNDKVRALRLDMIEAVREKFAC